MEPIKISDELKIISGNALRIHLPSDRTIDSSTVKQACDTVKTFKITKINISNEFSPNFDSLNFLTDFSEVASKIVEVNLGGKLCDLDNLYIFNNLENLFCFVKNNEIVDLSRFAKLKRLSTTRLESYINLGIPPIQTLHIHGFEPCPRPKLNPELLSQLKHLRSINLSNHVTDFSFEDVNGWDNLERVVITQCNIRNLNGIEKFTQVKDLTLWHCSSLNDIIAINKLPNLLSLDIGPCPRLKGLDVLANNNKLRALCFNSYKNVDIEIIKTLKELRFLYLYHCNPIPSIKFIDDLKKMVGLTLLSTKIIDGDLTPAMRLKDTDIMVMRHYNIDEDKLPSDMKYSYPYSIDLLLNS